jgi:hypothetical protein
MVHLAYSVWLMAYRPNYMPQAISHMRFFPLSSLQLSFSVNCCSTSGRSVLGAYEMSEL